MRFLFSFFFLFSLFSFLLFSLFQFSLFFSFHLIFPPLLSSPPLSVFFSFFLFSFFFFLLHSGDRYDDSTRTFTTSTIFIHFDAMTRVLAAPDNDPDDINGGRSPLSLCLATGTSAMDGFLSALEGKDDEISLDLANVGNQAYHNANPRGTVGYPMDSLGGLTLKDISETMLIGDPKVAGVSFLFILFLFLFVLFIFF